MKVLIVNFSDITGGAAIATYRLHKALLSKGLDSKILVQKKISSEKTILINKNKFIALKHKIMNYLATKLIKIFLKTKNKVIHSISLFPSGLAEYINKIDVDIVHLNWIQHEMISIKEISKINKPIVWTLHDMWAFCGAEHYTNDYRWRDGYTFYNRPKHEFLFDLNKWTWLRKLKYWKNRFTIVTPSSWLNDCVNNSYLMKDWETHLIHNCINTKKWKPYPKNSSRDYFKLSKNKTLILFGAADGTNDHRKGFDLLNNSLKILDENKTEYQLVIFGSKNINFHDLKLGTRVIDYLKDEKSLIMLYSACDLLVLPSRMDNLPNIALEAISCGMPIVAFDIGGLGDLITHKHNGYLANPFCSKDMATGIEWILENNKYSNLNKYSRRKAKDFFSYDRISSAYIEIYKMLIKK